MLTTKQIIIRSLRVILFFPTIFTFANGNNKTNKTRNKIIKNFIM